MTDITRFPVPALDELPHDLREYVHRMQERSGFVPNVFLALAHRPDECRAFIAYHDALMEREGGLSRAEREMIVVATSAADDCLYCVVAPGALVRVRAKDALVADQIAVDHRTADITPAGRAMLDFAVKLAREPQTITDGDFTRLRSLGFDDEDIWDIGAITAFFALSDRMAHLARMRPNSEFAPLTRRGHCGATVATLPPRRPWS